MGVSIYQKRAYRVRRVINGIRLEERFPLTEEGLKEANELDLNWQKEQELLHEINLTTPVIDSDGLIKGIYFRIRKNKIGPDSVVLVLQLPGKKNRESKNIYSIDSLITVFTEFYDNYKDFIDPEKLNFTLYTLNVDKIIESYKKEYKRLTTQVKNNYKSRFKEINDKLNLQRKLRDERKR